MAKIIITNDRLVHMARRAMLDESSSSDDEDTDEDIDEKSSDNDFGEAEKDDDDCVSVSDNTLESSADRHNVYIIEYNFKFYW